MNKQRLEKMATMLDEIEAGTWEPPESAGISSDGLEFDLRFFLTGKSGPDCATSACAVGHAMLDPRFPELEADTDLDPQFGYAFGWDAVNEYFEIDSLESEYLFLRPSYPVIATAGHVAARIREFIDNGIPDYFLPDSF